MAKDKKSKKGQEEGGEEEVKVQPGKEPSNDDIGTAKQGGKKGKKNRKKDDWEDEVANELEALSLETKGETKPPVVEEDSLPEKKQKEKTRGKADPSHENTGEENFKSKQTKKQRGKKGRAEESDDESISTVKSGKKSSIVSDDEEVSIKDNKKTKKGKKVNVQDSDDEDSIAQKKSKGTKKGKVVDSDDDSVDVGKNQKKKKGQKGRDVSDDEMDTLNDSKSNKRKGKKTQEILSDDETSKDTDGFSNKQKQKKGKGADQKKKGTKGKYVDSDDEDEKETKSNVSKATNVSKSKSGFQLLEMDDMDMDIDDDSDESIPEVKTKKQPEKPKPKVDDDEMDVVDASISETKKDAKVTKKSKKKDKKRKDDDEEDVDKVLEELAMELEGKKPPEKPKEESKEASEESIAVAEDVKPSETDEQSKKKKKKKKGDAESPAVEKPSDDKEPSPELAAGEEPTVKTAAQKKKEKKERERLKKLAQNEQERVKGSTDSALKEQGPVTRAASAAAVAAATAAAAAVEVKPPQEEESQAVDDDKADEDGVDDKKKKKKKKKGEEEKKEKKGPGKKAIAAMQEALKKVKEEEERLQREEEERQRAAEEAERLRQEKLRLEQERKEKKKQKEKEKRERLKAEGKLLSKTQRQARARMEATLEALRQQGVEVPQIGEKIEKKPRLGDRKRTPRKKEEEKQTPDVVTPEVKVEIVVEAQKPEENETQDNTEVGNEDSEADDVKDAWDETTEDESEKDEADQEEEKSPVKSEVSALESPLKKQESVEESDESTESDDSSSGSDTEEESSSSDDDGKTQEERIKERALERIRKRREEAEKNRSVNKLRSPVVCVLGHVDTGKTKILDKIRKTNVQDCEAGGITQQIGATMVPQEALKEKCKMVKSFTEMELKVPGLLIIDTPGHESFSNLRSRGSSLCDIAVLVVDIMHGLQQQTIESINLLKMKKTPFIVALNKIDRLYEWKSGKNKDVQDVIKSQARNTKMEFEKRTKEIIVQFAEQSLNAALYYENTDPRSWISMVPTSAFTGDGMGNLMALIVELTQSMMTKRISYTEELQATVLEVKAIHGLGTTIDVILVNGKLREGDTIVLAGHDGAMVTQIRGLHMPQPLKELRVKNPYEEFKEVEGAQGVKISGRDLDKAIAGLQLLVAHHPDEVEILKEEVNRSLQDAMNAIKLAERGVYVQASTLGSLEALLEFLKVSKIPYSGIRIGPVVKKDVMKASIMLEHDSQYAVILAFDVRIERDAQELADSLGVKIFPANIIYHLFDNFMKYREELKNKKREEFKNIAVFPCKLRILPQFIFNSRDPIVVGVVVEAGVVKDGTPLCVPTKEFLDIGTVSTIEINHKTIDSARKGQEVCIKIEPNGGEAPKMFGRHFDETDMLVSKISRQSIDACKEYFRDDLQKTDWQLMVELKKTFQIL